MHTNSTLPRLAARIALALLALVAMNALALVVAQDAEPSGTILAYAGHQEEWALLTVQEFERRYPNVTVEFIRMSGGAALSRIRAEQARPQASVWWGGPADTFISAAGEGLLEPYISPEAERIDARFKDENGTWTGFYVGILGFTLNERAFADLDVAPPESWQDLLRPEFRDRIVMANPGTSGTAYTVLATLVQLMGEEEAFEYLRELHSNVQQYPTSGSAAGQMAGLGEVAIGIDFGHAVPQLAAQGYPVFGTYPSEGTGFEIGAIALLADAPNPDLAKLFIDFVISAEGQELGARAGAFQLLTHADATSPEEAIPLDQAVLIDYDFTWAGENRQRLVERWDDEIFTAPR